MSFVYMLQVQLYEDFARSKAKKEVEMTLSEDGAGEEETGEGEREMEKKAEVPATHIFQVLNVNVSCSYRDKLFTQLFSPIVSLSVPPSPSLLISSIPCPLFSHSLSTLTLCPTHVSTPLPSHVPTPITVLYIFAGSAISPQGV